VHLLVTQTTTGGRWRFPLRLHALPPLVDDVITIEGAINKVSAVAFKLRNSSNQDRHFRAFFTKDSSTEFAVAPTSGILKSNEIEPEGTEFVIAYRASNYGKFITGTLIIEVCYKTSFLLIFVSMYALLMCSCSSYDSGRLMICPGHTMSGVRSLEQGHPPQKTGTV
jgi:hypothetical protein